VQVTVKLTADMDSSTPKLVTFTKHIAIGPLCIQGGLVVSVNRLAHQEIS